MTDSTTYITRRRNPQAVGAISKLTKKCGRWGAWTLGNWSKCAAFTNTSTVAHLGGWRLFGTVTWCASLHTFNVVSNTRFNIWSCSKTFTGTAWGLLLGDSRQGKLPNQQQVDLDSPAYAFIPGGSALIRPAEGTAIGY